MVATTRARSRSAVPPGALAPDRQAHLERAASPLRSPSHTKRVMEDIEDRWQWQAQQGLTDDLDSLSPASTDVDEDVLTAPGAIQATDKASLARPYRSASSDVERRSRSASRDAAGRVLPSRNRTWQPSRGHAEDRRFLEHAIESVAGCRSEAERAMFEAWNGYEELIACSDEKGRQVTVERMCEAVTRAEAAVEAACALLKAKADAAMSLRTPDGRENATVALENILNSLKETQREVSLLKPLKSASWQDVHDSHVDEGLEINLPAKNVDDEQPTEVSKPARPSSLRVSSPKPGYNHALSSSKPISQIFESDLPTATGDAEVMMRRLKALGLVQRVQDPSVLVDLIHKSLVASACVSTPKTDIADLTRGQDRPTARPNRSRSRQRGERFLFCCSQHKQPCVLRNASVTGSGGQRSLRSFFCCPLNKNDGGCGFQKWVKAKRGTRRRHQRNAERSASAPRRSITPGR